MGGSIQSFNQPTGFNKYIGTQPIYSDNNNWYSTIAAATPTAGDRILVVNGYTLTATETWAFNNVTIVFMPNQQLLFTAATTRAIYITGNYNKIYDMWTRLNLTTLTSGVEISGTDNQLYGLIVESYNAGLTLTNACNIIGSRNSVLGDRLVTSGAITNKSSLISTDSVAIISGSIVPYDIGVASSTGMLNVNGFSRISSPTQSSTQITNGMNIDCSLKHINYYSAPASNGAYTLHVINLVEGQTVNVVVAASASITYTLAWTTPSIIWGPTGTPTPTTANSKYDFYTFIKVGGLVFGTAILAMA